MNVLIVGNGGREHAIAWKVAQSPRAAKVYVAPGNGGTAIEPGVTNVPIAAADAEALTRFATDNAIDLTIVGPEAPLVEGLVDRFQSAGLRCFGPSRAAAQLEGSKAFAKAFMQRHGIPTAAAATFTDLAAARDYLHQQSAPVVVKADGLAAGKGVIIAHDLSVAEAALEQMLASGRFGAAGSRVVIEEFLRGEEASFIAMVDGEQIVPLATSQDHKARDDGDQGPNTGGMGAYSPAPIVDGALHERIMREVMRPTIAGLAQEGIRYTGFLYAGLMIDPAGVPRVLEYNCRLGDPEAQPILLRMESDFLALVDAAERCQLGTQDLQWTAQPALGVVMAAEGYPATPRRGDRISGLHEAAMLAGTKVFHAGTRRREDGSIVTDGGRVLCVTSLGVDFADAQRRSYGGVAAIDFAGCFCRTDIGHRAISRPDNADSPARASTANGT